MAIAKLVLGIGEPLFFLGNLNSCRDWGHAKDYVEGMHLILQQKTPEDFVLATGITTSIRDFVKECFKQLNIEIGFRGQDENEVGFIIECKGKYQLKTNSVVLKVDKKYFRPTEVDLLIGDATKAKNKLNWSPKYTLEKLIEEMIKSDIEILNKTLK
jgi:GDPmannose 4,6-dehydratase